MKLTFVIIFLAILVVLIFLSVYSRFAENHSLVDDRLAPNGNTPNSICTENYPNKNYNPIQINNINSKTAWSQLKKSILKAGGEIHTDTGLYLWSTFTTPVFKFVDNFECRLDTVNNQIHLRSASRVGYSDFGTNRERADLVIDIFTGEIEEN